MLDGAALVVPESEDGVVLVELVAGAVEEATVGTVACCAATVAPAALWSLLLGAPLSIWLDVVAGAVTGLPAGSGVVTGAVPLSAGGAVVLSVAAVVLMLTGAESALDVAGAGALTGSVLAVLVSVDGVPAVELSGLGIAAAVVSDVAAVEVVAVAVAMWPWRS